MCPYLRELDFEMTTIVIPKTLDKIKIRSKYRHEFVLNVLGCVILKYLCSRALVSDRFLVI